ADTLAGWRREGILPAGTRTFAVHADVAHYLAWFCPGERSFLDSRLSLFLPVAADYRRVCLALDPNETAAPAWPQTLRDHHIACLLLDDPDRPRPAPALPAAAGPAP